MPVKVTTTTTTTTESSLVLALPMRFNRTFRETFGLRGNPQTINVHSHARWGLNDMRVCVKWIPWRCVFGSSREYCCLFLRIVVFTNFTVGIFINGCWTCGGTDLCSWILQLSKTLIHSHGHFWGCSLSCCRIGMLWSAKRTRSEEK